MPTSRFAFPLPGLARLRRAAARAALAAFALLAASCADNGTSSGVDNPSLTVNFTGAEGGVARVTGSLDVYAADQNPALDAEPLATVQVKNSAFTLVTGDDFKRAQQAATKRAATKRAAGEGAAGPADRTAFNLVFTTQDKHGGIALGLVYDSAARAFTRSDSALKSIALQPKPLVRYVARVAKEAVHGEDCRVFVPGTPYLATVVDSQFVIEDLPQGLLPLSLIGADGKIYPVPDSLNTDDSGKLYHPSAIPSGSLDTVRTGDSIPDFQVFAPDPQEIYQDAAFYLDAKLAGISPDDPRLSVLWKWLPDTGRSPLQPPPPDSSHHDGPGDKPLSPLAELVSPASLRTQVVFHGDGLFRFLISVTAGARARFDTAVVNVRRPSPDAVLLSPKAGDTLVAGRAYTVQWQMASKGPYTLEVSIGKTGSWIPVASHYQSPEKLQYFPWTPSADLGTSEYCQLRVRDEVDTLQVAVSRDYFRLMK